MDILGTAEEFAKKEYAKHDPVHQYPHVEEVMELAMQFAKFRKTADIEIVKLAVLFHDISYKSVETHVEDSAKAAEAFLKENNYPKERTARVKQAILEHSTTLRKKIGDAKSIEGKILYDADKFRLCLTYDGYRKYYDFLYLEETKQLVNQVIRHKFGAK